MVLCGNDITSVIRIKKAIEKGGDSFLKRVFTDEEITYCESRRMRKIQKLCCKICCKRSNI